MIESALVKPAAPRAGALLANPSRDVDIVVPVYNEEAALEQSIRRLHRFLSESFPFAWRIVIADNASTDGTPAIARSRPSCRDALRTRARPAGLSGGPQEAPSLGSGGAQAHRRWS